MRLFRCCVYTVHLFVVVVSSLFLVYFRKNEEGLKISLQYCDCIYGLTPPASAVAAADGVVACGGGCCCIGTIVCCCCCLPVPLVQDSDCERLLLLLLLLLMGGGGLRETSWTEVGENKCY